jgi:hypothetical protein
MLGSRNFYSDTFQNEVPRSCPSISGLGFQFKVQLNTMQNLIILRQTMAKRKRDRDPQPTKPPARKKNKPKSTKKPRHSGRQVTVYDAVANRASYEGFIKSTLRKNVFGEKHRRSQKAYPADEVLARRKHAPEEPIPFGEGERETGLPDSVCVCRGNGCEGAWTDLREIGFVDCHSPVCFGFLCGEWDGAG